MAYKYPEWLAWPRARTAVVAEVGLNHGGDVEVAWEMIQSAHRHGADFVKLQSFDTAKLLHPSLDYYEATRALELSRSAQESLFVRARSESIALVTTPFDTPSLELAEAFNPPFHKVASMDVDNMPLLTRVAETGRPVIVSCGMASNEEIADVVNVMSACGNDKLVLLHCVSDYPAEERSLNLAMIPFLQDRFHTFVGLSDHTVGLTGAHVASSLGAAVVEKHFTLDRSLAASMPAADHELSMEPEELGALRRFFESVPIVMGKAPRTLTVNEEAGRHTYRRGIYAGRDIAAGETLELENVTFLRPVKGLPAGAWNDVRGRRAACHIAAESPITASGVEH